MASTKSVSEAEKETEKEIGEDVEYISLPNSPYYTPGDHFSEQTATLTTIENAPVTSETTIQSKTTDPEKDDSTAESTKKEVSTSA